MRIFYGLNITSKVSISKLVLTIQPYDKNQDVLGLLSDADAREYLPLPVKAKYKAGMMTIVAPISSVNPTDFTEWNKVLTYLAYKLDIPVSESYSHPILLYCALLVCFLILFLSVFLSVVLYVPAVLMFLSLSFSDLDHMSVLSIPMVNTLELSQCMRLIVMDAIAMQSQEDSKSSLVSYNYLFQYLFS
jgi:hypothetical protein